MQCQPMDYGASQHLCKVLHIYREIYMHHQKDLRLLPSSSQVRIRPQWLMEEIFIYLSVFKGQNHYLCVREGILLL